MYPNTVADARQKYRFRCDICGEPIGMLNEASHKQAAHADIMNLRRSMSARYLRRYLPLALFGLVLGGFSVFIHQWWWRLGFLGGIYLMLVVLVVFVRRAWREEKPLHRAIRLRCPVCDVQMSSQDLRIHLPAEHPEIYRLMKRTAWLLVPALWVFLVYVFALIGVQILGWVPESSLTSGVWYLFLIGPLVVWMLVIAAVGIILNRTKLRPARESWRNSRPFDR